MIKFVAGVAISFLAAGNAPPAQSMSEVQSRIEADVRGFGGVMGVAAIDLTKGETIAVNADTRFPTASLIKVPVMVEVFHQIAEGKLQREKTVTLREQDKVGDETVVLNQLRPLLPDGKSSIQEEAMPCTVVELHVHDDGLVVGRSAVHHAKHFQDSEPGKFRQREGEVLTKASLDHLAPPCRALAARYAQGDRVPSPRERPNSRVSWAV